MLLILAPWTRLWEHNYFGDLLPWLDVAMENLYVRGAVSGVGVITAWTGVRDIASAIAARWSGRTPPAPPAP